MRRRRHRVDVNRGTDGRRTATQRGTRASAVGGDLRRQFCEGDINRHVEDACPAELHSVVDVVSRRDDFSAATVATLARRAGHRCSRPDCRASTSGPSDDPLASVNLGVAGHITAAAPGGPRYDGSLSRDQRRHIENGIWLCQRDARLVDSDNGRFSVEELSAWKLAAERAARRELGLPAGPGGRVAILERTLRGHSHYVWDVIVTGDGRRAISASNDGTAGLWDLRTGQRLCTYVGARAEVCSIALSPGGERVAGGCLNGDVLVWRLHSPEPEVTLSHGTPDAKVAWPGSGLLTAGADGCLRRWTDDLEVDAECTAHSAPVLKVTALGDGRIATASEDGTVRVWSSDLDRLTGELRGHSGHVNSVALAEAGGFAVTGSQDCTVRVWALDTCAPLRTLEGHCDQVWRVAVDAAERWIASGAGDDTVLLWDLAEGQPIDELRHDDCVAAVAFSPDSTRLVVGCDDALLYVYRLG